MIKKILIIVIGWIMAAGQFSLIWAEQEAAVSIEITESKIEEYIARQRDNQRFERKVKDVERQLDRENRLSEQTGRRQIREIEQRLTIQSREASRKKIKEIEEKISSKEELIAWGDEDPLKNIKNVLYEAIVKENLIECNELSDTLQIDRCRRTYLFLSFIEAIYKRDEEGAIDIFNEFQELKEEIELFDEEIRGLYQAFLSLDISKAEAALNSLPLYERLRFSAMITGDISYADGISDYSFVKDWVIYLLAVRREDVTIAEEIENPTLRMMCELYFNKDMNIYEDYYE